MDHKRRRVFIVGGSGFLGTETAILLKKNSYDVYIADLLTTKNNCPKDIPFIPIDITNLYSLEGLNIKENDIIVNLASKQYHNQLNYFNRQKQFDSVNLYGANNLMDKAITSKAAGYIFFSSDMVYGNPKEIPVLEDSELNPLAEYGYSKLKAEKSLIKKAKNIIPLTIFRPRLISGPGRLGIFNILFWFIQKSLPVPIIGSGNNCYQMVSVFDCANAILLAIEKDIPSKIFNLGSERKIQIQHLINELIMYASSKSMTIPIYHNIVKPILFCFDKIGMTILYPEQFLIADKNYILDINKVKRSLGWNPQFDDQQMIIQAYEHWLKLKK